MSLQHAAKHLASKGRHGDTTLVHMTKGEVAGLQALAQNHGTSMTINPHTGLPEAFSLKSLLPMAAGFMLGGPMGMSAMASALTVGGISTLATGSLKQGLIAGLGAYGGAGLGSGVGGVGSVTGTEGAGAGAGANPLPEVADVGSAAGSSPVTANPVTQGSVQGTELGSFNESGQAASGFQPSQQAYTGTPQTQTSSGIDFGGPGSSPSNMGAQPTAAGPTYSADTAQSGIDLGGPGSSPANTGAPPSRFDRVVTNAETNPKLLGYAAAPGIVEEMTPEPYKPEEAKVDADMGQRYSYDSGYSNDVPGRTGPATYSQISDTDAKKLYGFAEGGNVQFPYGESVVRMAEGGSAADNVGYGVSFAPGQQFDSGANYSGYGVNSAPTQQIGSGIGYSGYDTTPNQGIVAALPATRAVITPRDVSQDNDRIYLGDGKYGYDESNGDTISEFVLRAAKMALGQAEEERDDGYTYNPKTQQYVPNMAAGGGISTLGGYSDGGRLLKGPGDGMSDNIPAKIGSKQPARLADGEFVVPADVVSHLGNGSTDAGAKQLYKMMDKIRTARTGRKAQGKQVNPNKFLPA
jgi:hypothetical protein